MHEVELRVIEEREKTDEAKCEIKRLLKQSLDRKSYSKQKQLTEFKTKLV